MNLLVLTLALQLAPAQADTPQKILLWPEGAPGAKGNTEADQPSLTIYRPKNANGTAVVVCPGGGYGHLAVGHEGKEIAEWMIERGITAFVLRYRISPKYKHPAPIQDAQRALRYVRSNAKKFGIDPTRIGIMGFSAGGHLASTAATHFDDGKPDAAEAIDQTSCRPDFAILCYPVITLRGPFHHAGSCRNLLGNAPEPKLLASLCNETQVTAKTPPTFLFHTSEDRAVPPENSVLFYLALRKAKVPVEMHIYEKGRHGVGLAAKDPVLSTWSERLSAWLNGRGLLGKATP